MEPLEQNQRGSNGQRQKPPRVRSEALTTPPSKARGRTWARFSPQLKQRSTSQHRNATFDTSGRNVESVRSKLGDECGT